MRGASGARRVSCAACPRDCSTRLGGWARVQRMRATEICTALARRMLYERAPGSPRTLAHACSLPPPGHRLTTASVDAQATKSDEAWTPEEEEELVKLVAHEEYRKVRLGDTTTKWAPIAAHFSRTVKAVKRKFDKLQNPSKGVEGDGKRAGAGVESFGGCLGRGHLSGWLH